MAPEEPLLDRCRREGALNQPLLGVMGRAGRDRGDLREPGNRRVLEEQPGCQSDADVVGSADDLDALDDLDLSTDIRFGDIIVVWKKLRCCLNQNIKLMGIRDVKFTFV